MKFVKYGACQNTTTAMSTRDTIFQGVTLEVEDWKLKNTYIGIIGALLYHRQYHYMKNTYTYIYITNINQMIYNVSVY